VLQYTNKVALNLLQFFLTKSYRRKRSRVSW